MFSLYSVVSDGHEIINDNSEGDFEVSLNYTWYLVRS